MPSSPGPVSGDDFDLDAHIDWLVEEIDAGRKRVPPEWAVEGPTISLSLGDACDVDPELLAGMCGPDGLGGQAVSAAFRQDRAADALRPGPVLAALAAQTVADPAALTDDELVGALQAARRLANHADYQQTIVIAEYARRRQAQFEAAKAAGKPVGCRDGEFPGEELAMELVETAAYTGTAPACNAQAVLSDLDHTVPYPAGPTDQCNLNPKCRRHHRTKQAPGWRTAQPTPDTVTWTTPSGRTHTTSPTAYDL